MRGPTERRRDAGRAESAPSVTRRTPSVMRRDPGREELPAPAWQPQRITQAFTFPERRETIRRYATTTSHHTSSFSGDHLRNPARATVPRLGPVGPRCSGDGARPCPALCTLHPHLHHHASGECQGHPQKSSEPWAPDPGACVYTSSDSRPRMEEPSLILPRSLVTSRHSQALARHQEQRHASQGLSSLAGEPRDHGPCLRWALSAVPQLDPWAPVFRGHPHGPERRICTTHSQAAFVE